MAPVYTILLLEGRKTAGNSLALVLEKKGYRVVVAHTRREARAQLNDAEPAVVVVDAPSLRLNANRLCQTLRRDNDEVPILMLIGEHTKIERGTGASLHLRYPFGPRKLCNRIARLLPAPDGELLRVGDLVLNIEQRRISRGKQGQRLTPRQARLLEVLMRHPGEVLSRAYLMKEVWETDYVDDTRTLDVHIHWVRKAIEDDPRNPVCLQTVRRRGYRLAVPDQLTKSSATSKP